MAMGTRPHVGAAAAAPAARPARVLPRCAAAAAAAAAPADEPAPPSRRRALSAALLAGLAAAAPAGAPRPAAAAAAPSVLDGQGAVRLVAAADEESLPPGARQALVVNRRTQRQNGAPPDFPLFARDGFDVTVLASEGYVESPEGLIYKDYVLGAGAAPGGAGAGDAGGGGDAGAGGDASAAAAASDSAAGAQPSPAPFQRQAVFDYTAYNESGAAIDSSYRKGAPAEVLLGAGVLVPGFELGLAGMRPGGKRRVVVPPALGPPVGPATFFAAKQFEVFDVELRRVKRCERRGGAFASSVVCE